MGRGLAWRTVCMVRMERVIIRYAAVLIPFRHHQLQRQVLQGALQSLLEDGAAELVPTELQQMVRLGGGERGRGR